MPRPTRRKDFMPKKPMKRTLDRRTYNLVPNSSKNPWDRMWHQGYRESVDAYGIFKFCLDSGPERGNLKEMIEKYYAATGRRLKYDSVKLWHSKYQWENRIAAYGKHIEDLKRKVFEEERMEAVKKHATLLQKRIELMTTPDQALAEKLSENELETMKQLKQQSVTTLLDIMNSNTPNIERLIKQHRLALGLSTDNKAIHKKEDVKVEAGESLKRYQETMQSIRKEIEDGLIQKDPEPLIVDVEAEDE